MLVLYRHIQQTHTFNYLKKQTIYRGYERVLNYRDVREFQSLDWLWRLEELHFLYDEHLVIVVHCFQHCAFLFLIEI